MLTNNKKSYFVKSIAMIMAVLMVLAVALTGCGNKAAEEAATKAENAQSTANEAKTAAQAVADALNDYLKITDAVKRDAIETMIADALSKFGTDLEAATTFVKNDEAYTALVNKISSVYLKTEVDAAIADAVAAAVAGKATQTEVEALIEALETAVEGDIAAAIATCAKPADLAAYLKSEDWATKFNASFAAALTEAKAGFNYLTESDLDGIKTNVSSLLTKVTAAEGEIAGIKTNITNITNTLNGVEGKINTALANYYTKAEVDAMMATLNSKDATMAAQIAQLQEIVYQILSAFLPKEEVETLTGENVDFGELLEKWDATTIAGAIADKWSLEEWNTTTPEVIKAIAGIQELLNDLYDGEWVGDDFIADKAYTKANKDAINAALAPLNITIFDKDYNVADYDTVAQTLEYAFLRAANTADLKVMLDAVNAAKDVPHFEEELEAVVDTVFEIGHKHGDNQYVNIDDADEFNAFTFAYDTLVSKYLADNAFAGTKLATTYGTLAYMTVWQNPTDATKFVVAAAGATEYKTGSGETEVVWKKYEAQPITILTASVGNEWRKLNSLGIDVLPNGMSTFTWEVVTGYKKVAVADVHGGYDVTVAVDPEDAAQVYGALAQQFMECHMAIYEAQTAFKGFLTGTVKEYGVYENVALKDKTTKITDAEYLGALTIEMCTTIVNSTVPAAAAKLSGDVTTKMTAAVKRNTCDGNITAAVKAAINTNGATEDDYQLYLDMHAKVASEMFTLYQTYAQDMLEVILQDYVSVVYAADKDLDDYKNVVTLTGDKIAAGTNPFTPFVEAAMNGGTYTWTSTATEEGSLKVVKTTFDALNKYYANNNSAGEAYNANPVYTIQQNVEEMVLFLHASVIGVRDNIANLTFTAAQGLVEGTTPAYMVFEDRLESAVANLDEVFARFLYADFVKVQINDVYDYATTMANLYSGTGDAELIAAMQDYLIGTTEGDNVLFPNNGLANGSLLAALAADTYTVNTHEKIAEVVDINKTVTADKTGKKALVINLIDTFEEKLENMAIKRNFLEYLETATLNLQNIYLNYRAISGVRYALVIELSGAYNVADSLINMTKWQEQYGAIKIDEYKERYSEVLALIFDKVVQKAHVDQLFGEAYIAAQEALVKSNATKAFLSGTSGVKKPLAHDFLGQAITGYVNDAGETVKGFDEIVNTDTKYTEGTTVVYLYPAKDAE